MTYQIVADGDSVEKYYWPIFLEDRFPSYEKYWQLRIVPLTNRPKNINFKSDSELQKLGFNDEDICLAQLHYTIFRHMARSFEICKHLESKEHDLFYSDYLSEGFYHIVAAQDVAFEFLQRLKKTSFYDPWASKKKESLSNKEASFEARRTWIKENHEPLNEIRQYRNNITHGRIIPKMIQNSKIYMPRIGYESKYLDWRTLNEHGTKLSDFDAIDVILNVAWERTISYFDKEWEVFFNCKGPT
ncbi:MAG TPA: hypothetical protein PK915_09530 [Bacteroidales bacterium]|nr:hypothetical protein [Bacteroidales bacterium]